MARLQGHVHVTELRERSAYALDTCQTSIKCGCESEDSDEARLQQDVDRELPDVQAGFRNGRGTRDQIANTRWIMEEAREFQKNVYFCSLTTLKPLTM